MRHARAQRGDLRALRGADHGAKRRVARCAERLAADLCHEVRDHLGDASPAGKTRALHDVARGVACAHEGERSAAGREEGTEAVCAEIGVHGRPIRAGRARRGRVVLRGDPDVAALRVVDDDEPRVVRRAQDARHGREALRAVALEARSLDLHRSRAVCHGIDDADRETLDRGRAGGQIGAVGRRDGARKALDHGVEADAGRRAHGADAGEKTVCGMLVGHGVDSIAHGGWRCGGDARRHGRRLYGG